MGAGLLMEYIKLKMTEIIPYQNNPRNVENAVDDVAESIRQCGYISPIIVDEEKVILAGHTRYEALKKLGYSECDVVMVSGLSEDQKKKYRLYDNKAGEIAEWDQEKLITELFDVNFEGYDFGQPKYHEFHEEDGDGGRIKKCPCCGEEFEV